MNYKKQKNLITEAMDSGCKTVSEFALFLKVRAWMTS